MARSYQVTLPGYNGATDETDHLVKWVRADSLSAVLVWAPQGSIVEELDFNVPAEEADVILC
jgi:hypothetical protein